MPSHFAKVKRPVIYGLAVSALLLLNGCEQQLTAEQQQAKMDWQAWVAKENSSSKEGQHSFLNIRDARYMRPGDIAKLT